MNDISKNIVQSLLGVKKLSKVNESYNLCLWCLQVGLLCCCERADLARARDIANQEWFTATE